MNWPASAQFNLMVSMFHALIRLPRGVRLERTQVVGLALYHALSLLAFAPRLVPGRSNAVCANLPATCSVVR